LNAPLILCCASGNRSGQAQHFLSELGIECYNGGSWLDVNIIYHKQQNKMINTLKNLFGLGPKVDYADLVKQGAIILDVRSPGEYKQGHIKVH
jgi:rhodanese-related sulfurtransferase